MLTWVWYWVTRSRTMFDQVISTYLARSNNKMRYTVKYSNEIYRPNNLMLQTKSQGHWPLGSRKYFKCLIVYGHGGHCKVGLGQLRIIIFENLVEPTFPMLHTMSQTHWPFDFRDDLKNFYLYGRGGYFDHKQMEILIRFGQIYENEMFRATFFVAKPSHRFAYLCLDNAKMY